MKHIQLRPIRFVLLVSLSCLICFTSCKDDEETKTLPTVVTTEVQDVTTTTATAGGEIVSTGNATITSNGVVYSSTNNSPTIDDNKVEATNPAGPFTVNLTELASGTQYYARAYATNEVGTAYGESVTFTTGNAGPTVTDVTISGDLEVNKPLTVTYTFNDAEGDGEGATSVRWYVAETASGTGETIIENANGLTYVPIDVDEFKYVAVEILPKAVSGTIDGAPAKSNYVGPIGARTTITFTYNGEEVTYGIITSPETGRQWLDRNLGATRSATAVDDHLAYGDLFQWGRQADGHQLISWTGPTEGTPMSGTTTELSNSDTPDNGALFILRSLTPWDWRDPANDYLWQGVNGINNPCPQGWRIPTSDEWAAENIDVLATGFERLKLTAAGTRSRVNGDLSVVGSHGNYWTSTLATDGIRMFRYSYRSTSFFLSSTGRADGVSCRCIKD